MNRKNAMYLALFSAVSGTAAAAPPTEMDAAPVTTAPQAAAWCGHVAVGKFTRRRSAHARGAAHRTY